MVYSETFSIGFSTGSLAHQDMWTVLARFDQSLCSAVELSALRVAELRPMLAAVDHMDLERFGYVSVHAPSAFDARQEAAIAEALLPVIASGWPVVVHPDVIRDWGCWTAFGAMLCVENMDKRKPTGRTVSELAKVFQRLPDASFCFDLAHARQCDTSMTEAYLILCEFKDRLKQVHISDLDVDSRHSRLSWGAMHAYVEIADLIPDAVPVIIESPISPDEVDVELQNALRALGRLEFAAV